MVVTGKREVRERDHARLKQLTKLGYLGNWNRVCISPYSPSQIILSRQQKKFDLCAWTAVIICKLTNLREYFCKWEGGKRSAATKIDRFKKMISKTRYSMTKKESQKLILLPSVSVKTHRKTDTWRVRSTMAPGGQMPSHHAHWETEKFWVLG